MLSSYLKKILGFFYMPFCFKKKALRYAQIQQLRMDVQRSTKIGRPNYWVVIPITNKEIKSNLKEAQDHLKERNKTFKTELNHSLVDLDSNDLHITLFGIHANEERLQQVKESLQKFRKNASDDISFNVEFKGLGAWRTVSDNIILFADLVPESSQKVKQLAKQLRDFVLFDLLKHEAGTDNVASLSEDILTGMWMDDPLVNNHIIIKSNFVA
jgi:uncharacterized FlaG/YvyC family protein